MRRALRGRWDLYRSSHLAEVEAACLPTRSDAIFDPLQRGRRLRVLLASVFWDYGMKRRGVSYETTAFRDPLYSMGCDVIEVPLDVIAQRAGVGSVGDTLVETAFRHDADVVFFIPFKDEVQPEVLRRIRDGLGIPVLAWFSDDHWRFDSHTVHFLPAITAAITTSKAALDKYRSVGFGRVIRSQWSVNHRIFRPLEVRKEYDVSFIGQPHSDRRELVDMLRRAGLKVEARGFGWPEGRVSLSEMVRISNASKVCLNFGNASRGASNQVKGRDFELPAMRVPMVTSYSDEIYEYFAPGEIETYTSPTALREKVEELIGDAERRRALAEAGYRRALSCHTAERRLADVFYTATNQGWLGA